MRATSSSRSVRPFLMSTKNSTRSASSVATMTCLRISSSKISSLLTTQPPVSTTENSRPFHSHLPYWRSRVVPASSLTMARRLLVSLLNKVDLPTFGRPTIATKFPIVYSFLLQVFLVLPALPVNPDYIQKYSAPCLSYASPCRP